MPNDPYYRVRPRLHEPGPISMTQFTSGQGIPVRAGERLRLTATYDNRLPHTRVMGIMLVAFAPDPSADTSCSKPLPDDMRRFWLRHRGRTRTPLIRVPINGLPIHYRPGARATAIRRPNVRSLSCAAGVTCKSGAARRLLLPMLGSRPGCSRRDARDVGKTRWSGRRAEAGPQQLQRKVGLRRLRM